MNVRELVVKYLDSATSVEQLNRRVIADSVGCSIYQVSRQAGDLVRAKKECLNSRKPNGKPEKNSGSKEKVRNSNDFDLLMKELAKINKRLDSVESKINKINKDDWINYNGHIPPRGTKVKVKITGEGVKVGYSEDFDWGTYDAEYDREDARVYRLWSDYEHSKAYDFAMRVIEEKYPESVNYNLIGSAECNGISSDDEFYDLFQKIKSDYLDVISSEKRRIFNSEHQSFYEREFRAPSENGFIESYKLVDDSGERALKEIKKVLAAIESMSKKEREW